jgi:hypothetical protein
MINPKNILGPQNGSHIWNFSRVGGVNRVNLETGLDLISLEHLDQKLWTALSCPVYGLEIDFKTLELIDKDNDERIRVPEIIEAVKWVTSIIKNPDDLTKPNKSLPLDAINNNTEEGANLLKSARQILSNLGIPDNKEITVEETSDTVKIFANTKFNGDGIITEFSSDDDIIKILIGDIISCMGSAVDLSGKEGISSNHIDDFYKNCQEYSEWYTKAEKDLEKILPFGDSTADALTALLSVKSKIEDYFLRYRLAEFSPESSDILNSLNAQYEEISRKELSSCISEIAAFPLARIEKKKALSLTKGINPAWENAIDNFNRLVVSQVFPEKESLAEEDMEVMCRKFDTYNKWQSEKNGTSVEKLGIIRVREILGGNTKVTLSSLVEQDKALESNTNNIFLVDKLVRYYRDLYTLLNNYVTFHDFYSPDSEAIFQAGKLYIDQRCCDLCMKVRDMPKHNILARSSGLCLIYCDCYSKTMNERMIIVAALTDGDFDNIEVGRNAIYYDRKGNDWDATIIKVVDNPISIRQAFWSPYRKVSKFVSTQVEKVASAKEKEVDTMAASGIEKTIGKAPAQAAPPAPPFDIGKFVGIFAALSLALGAIGSVLASFITGFISLKWWMMPLALMAIMLIISGPSMIIAWLKLRKRNLAPLLDANGWAINARATINIIFGRTLTHIASLPPNSKLNLVDPFSKKKNPFIPILLILIAIIGISGYLLWYYGFFGKWGII